MPCTWPSSVTRAVSAAWSRRWAFGTSSSWVSARRRAVTRGRCRATWSGRWGSSSISRRCSPIRTELKGPAIEAASRSPFFDAAAAIDLTGSPPLLTDQSGYATATGAVNAGSVVYLANASSPNWSLTVNGRDAPRTKAFGWANEFRVDQAGSATLRFITPLSRYVLLAVQVALWATAIRRLRRWRAEERAVHR